MLDQRIQQQRQRIQQHSGDDSRLRSQLQRLQERRGGQQQDASARTGFTAPTPWNAASEDTVAGLRLQHDTDIAGITADEQATRKAYGFDNPSDPFSRANQLQQNFANANRGTTNNYAAAGQLYAGSLSNAHNIDRQNFEQGWDSAQKEYQARLNELAQRRLQADTDEQRGILDAEAKRLQDAAAVPVDPAEAPPPQGGRNQGGKNKPDKNKKGKH